MGKHNEAIENEDAEVQALMVSKPFHLGVNHELDTYSYQWQALATATYILDMMFIKLSIGVFLLRLCVKKVYNWIIWVSLTIISIWSIVLFFWNLFQCHPVEMQWDFRIKEGKCVSVDQIVSAAYAISVMTVVSDWLYVSKPSYFVPMLCPY